MEKRTDVVKQWDPVLLSFLEQRVKKEKTKMIKGLLFAPFMLGIFVNMHGNIPDLNREKKGCWPVSA